MILDIYDHYNTIIGDFKLLFIDLGDVKNTNSDMHLTSELFIFQRC